MHGLGWCGSSIGAGRACQGRPHVFGRLLKNVCCDFIRAQRSLQSALHAVQRIAAWGAKTGADGPLLLMYVVVVVSTNGGINTLAQGLIKRASYNRQVMVDQQV